MLIVSCSVQQSWISLGDHAAGFPDTCHGAIPVRSLNILNYIQQVYDEMAHMQLQIFVFPLRQPNPQEEPVRASVEISPAVCSIGIELSISDAAPRLFRAVEMGLYSVVSCHYPH